MDLNLWNQRKAVLTATDMTVLLAETPWGSEEEIWLTKQGLLEQSEPNFSMAAGIILEPIIRDKFASEHGWNLEWISKGKDFYSDPDLYLGATPDGICVQKTAKPVGYEVKTSSEEWMVLPDRVITQCLVGMIVTGLEYWTIDYYHMPKGFSMKVVIDTALGKKVELDWSRRKQFMLFRSDHEDKIALIKERAKSWWHTYMVAGLRPDPPEPKEKKPRKSKKAEAQPTTEEA